MENLPARFGLHWHQRASSLLCLIQQVQTLKTAVEAAAMLLRIDDVVSGIGKKEKSGGAPKSRMDDGDNVCTHVFLGGVVCDWVGVGVCGCVGDHDSGSNTEWHITTTCKGNQFVRSVTLEAMGCGCWWVVGFWFLCC